VSRFANLEARLDTKTDKEQLKSVESQRSLETPIDTILSFLDEGPRK